LKSFFVFVGDGRKALFLRNAGNEKSPNFKIERVFVDDNPPTHEQGSDRPGRAFKRAGTNLRSGVEAAIECLRTVLRVAPDYADAMFNLGLLLQRQNQYAEAADYWHRYLANDCQSEWAARARRSLKFREMQVRLTASARGRPAPRDGACISTSPASLGTEDNQPVAPSLRSAFGAKRT
jgi:tetratricopeptide (TPR) repeat protein